MKIAQVSPLFESVPPRCYGGTERVVAYLTDELVRQGHHVTLYASGDSDTQAELRACCPAALRLAKDPGDPLAAHLLMLERVFKESGEFDIVHFHIDPLQYPFLRRAPLTHVTTLHGRLDLPHLPQLYSEYREMPVVSISHAQREPLPMANWQQTVYNGLPADLYRFEPKPGEYLAFLGRMSPEKGPRQAIEIALRAGMPLRMAAKVDEVDRAYFEQVIRPMLRHPGIEFLGEIDDRDKQEFLGNAYALLFPIDWPEPFGLVMIEAMACGTPVIAYPRGSVPEVMLDGVTGFIVDRLEEAVAAVSRIADIDRAGCRRIFEQRFSARRMAQDYLALYHRLIEAGFETRHAG